MQELLDAFISNPSSIYIFLTRIALLIGAFLYIIFAFLVTRQIKLMHTTLESSFSGPLRLIGFLHLALAVIVFVLFLLIL